MKYSTALWFFPLLALITACSTTPDKQPDYAQFDKAREAQRFLEQGQPEQAARLYQNLANSQLGYQNQYRLLAAEAIMQSGDNAKAKRYLDKINSAKLSPTLRSQLNLLYAQLNLNIGNAERALDRLMLVVSGQLNNSKQRHYYQALAFAHSLTGNPLAAAKARIKLHPYLNTDSSLSSNNQAILEALMLLPRQTLILNQQPAPDILGGWMAIANILKQKTTRVGAFNQQFSAWQKQFPNHPANTDFLNDFLPAQQQAYQAPKSIAVFLPKSGAFAQAAQIIKDGIMAAYHQNSAQQVPLRFYDSSAANIVSLYDQAVNHGAELIIGPLIKSKIVELAKNKELGIPVLALNHIENLSITNLYQFGLSPLDDARQIAAKAAADGHHKALIMAPETRYGKRIAEYLSAAWEQTGGTVLGQQFYDPKQHDFVAPINNMLNLDHSKQRYQRLRKVLNRRIEFTPRRRHDVDIILLSATPTVARSLNPQLHFYQALDLPVYATSKIYNGVGNRGKDIDLNKIAFSDIPWLFSEAYQGELSLQNLQQQWRNYPRKHIRLMALGIDAYQLNPYLGALVEKPFQGATGILSVNAENRITRQLVSAVFKEGHPTFQGYINSTDGATLNAEYDENPLDQYPEYYGAE